MSKIKQAGRQQNTLSLLNCNQYYECVCAIVCIFIIFTTVNGSTKYDFQKKKEAYTFIRKHTLQV